MAEESSSIIEEHIHLDLGFVAFEEEKAIQNPRKHTPIGNHEDLIDYDDDDLSVATTKYNNPPPVEDEKLKLETQSSITKEVEVLKAHSKV
jgi:hypothetical protein